MGCRTEPAAVHIAYVLQRLHFFQFFIFFIIYMIYRKLHAFTAKKNHTTRRFFCTRLTFFTRETGVTWQMATQFMDFAACLNNPFCVSLQGWRSRTVVR